MTWLGWCLVTLGLVVWAVGRQRFVDELAEFLRATSGRVRPIGDQVDQLRQSLNISPGKDRCFFLRCYRNPD